MNLCILAGGTVTKLAAAAFTLWWTHSVEHIRWTEHWQVTPAGLVVAEARVEGSGAGMDPPDGARLIGGFWRWHPALPPLKEVVMRRSGATADWRICTASGCRPMGDYLPADADPVTLKICN